MDRTKRDFLNRKEEVEEYFLFLKILNNDNISIKYTHGREEKEKNISNKLQRIFIANSFLILYNIIESTVRNSIIEIYDKIKDDGIGYQNLSHNLQKIWVNQKIDNLKEGAFNHSTLQSNIQNIADNILTQEIIILSSDNIDISGNIDAQKIRELADRFGFEKSRDGRYLEDIKKKRNRLAHGEQTFHDIGKDFSFNQLNDFKENTFDYLENVIEKIEVFLEREEYLAR